MLTNKQLGAKKKGLNGYFPGKKMHLNGWRDILGYHSYVNRARMINIKSGDIYVYIYLYLPKGLNFSLTSNISLRRKLKTQAESDFIHILRYSDKILVDDPGEKKCSVGDVRCFLLWFLIFIFFFGRKHPRNGRKHPK